MERGVTKIDENGEVITKKMCYILLFIDSARSIASSLSNLVNNVSWKKFIELNLKSVVMIKNMKLVELNISFVTVFLNT